MSNITFCIYNSVREAYVRYDEQVICSFDEFAEFCKEQQVQLQNKEDGLMFNCCSYKTDYESPDWIKDPTVNKSDYIRRCKANVDKIHCLLLDVDGTQTLDEAITHWADYEFVVYSTYNHSESKDKFRLVLPLQQAITAEEFDTRHNAMCKAFNVDGASFTISQAFYFPSYSNLNKEIAFVYHNKQDNRYNALELPIVQRSQNVITVQQEDIERNLMSKLVLNTLRTGSNLHYDTALSLAILCKSYSITQNEYLGLVQQIAAHDSMLRNGEVDVAKLYNEAYVTRLTHKRTRDIMRKLNCDMWRFAE